MRHPPGDQIYKDKEVSMWELDAAKKEVFCENFSYISKLFLDHKTLFYDLTPFDFYVLTEQDEFGHHVVGYFSKDKCSVENNLSCILVLPFAQRSGYGKFLIDFSYQLSIIENRPGTPERPLSDLGHKSYISYWLIQIITYLLENEDSPGISID